jgi:hypothetical protein
MNYENFLTKYIELKAKAVDLSHILHQISPKMFEDFSPINEIFDANIYMNEKYIWMYSLEYTKYSYSSCGDDGNHYFCVPLESLFSDDVCEKYISTIKEEEKIKQEKILEDKRKEEDIKHKEELRKIEGEKWLLLRLMEKYPQIANGYRENQ